MRVVGIDPGYAIVGMGAIEYINNNYNSISYGAITTDANLDFNSRLEYIYDKTDLFIKSVKPNAVAIEKLFFYNNQKTAINVAQARGVILLAAKKNNVEIFEYTPLQVKTAVTGYGGAKKIQVTDMTKRLLRLNETPKPDDVADALAVAICHANSCGTALRNILYKKGIK